MEVLLIRYGYALLFLGVAVEGETFLIAASYMAQLGLFRLPWVIAIAIASNSAADQIYYLMARTRGRAWLERRFGQHPRYQKVLGLMFRHGNWLLLFSRFAFGFRIIIPATCGALGMPTLRFTLINFIASIIWAVPTALLGFYLGEAAARTIAGFKNYEFSVLLVLLAIGAVVLFVRYIRRAGWVEDLSLADVHMLIPALIGAMGALNLVTALWPRSLHSLRVVESWLPLEVVQPSRSLMLFSGIALLQVTRALGRRKEQAWYVASIALAVSLLVHATHWLDLQHSLVAGLLLAYLLAFRRRFYARSDPASLRLAFLMAPALAGAVMAYGYIGLRHLAGQFTWQTAATPLSEAFRDGILILEPNLDPTTNHAAHYLGSLQIAGWLARFYLLALFLRPVILRDRQEAPAARIREIFEMHGRHSLSAFAIQVDKHHYLVAEGRALVAFATHGSVALTCGDPLAADEDFERSVNEYLELCRKNGWTGCFYEVAEIRLPVYRSSGLRALKIAEEAVIDLKEFGLAGNKRANLRAMVNKTAKTGMTVRRYERNLQPEAAVDEQLEEISQEWLAEKRLGELGFTIGRFSLEGLGKVPAFTGAIGDRIEAFCSWLPYRHDEAVVLDLMRKRNTAPAGTMDFLLAHSLLQLQAAGYSEASLANAPLANVADPKGSLDRGVALLFENLNSFYGYKNLFQFKKKFAPGWEGRYLIYPKGADLPKITYAMTGVHSSGGLIRLLLGR
jgi:lysylphosphatidylglycerol synthetase-like protein (DUF2156 family)